MFTTINLIGLSLGLTCTLFIFLWVQDELSFDRFHKQTDQLYQLIREETFPDGSYEYLTATPGLLGPTLKHDYAEISNTCRVGWQGDYSVKFNDNLLSKKVRFVDPSFFQMFSYSLISGTLEDVFQHPNEVIITKGTALSLFGEDQSIGEVITIRDSEYSYDLKVVAVLDDFPGNTFIHGTEILIPYEAVANNMDWLNNWSGNAFQLYVQLVENADVDALNLNIADIIKRHTNNETYQVFLQPLSERYLYSDIKPLRQATGRIVYVRLFSVIAVFVLIIACINFMNLITARSSVRVKEVGVRKSIGANRGELFNQFMSEASLIVVTSLMLALLSTVLIMPFFNSLTHKNLEIPWGQPIFYGVILLIMIFTSALAGSYPSVYLASINTVKALKGKWTSPGITLPIRKVLVVFQFTLSIVLMITAWVVYKQVEYFKTQHLGFDQENVIYFQSTQEIQPRQEFFNSRLTQIDGVKSATFTGSLPTSINVDTSSPNWPGKDQETKIDIQILFTGLNFTETTKLKLITGRDFTSMADTNKILVNSTMAGIVGQSSIIGKPLTFWGNEVEIIGVTEDFNSQSLREPVVPVIIWLNPSWSENVLVRISPDDIDDTISKIAGVYHQFSSDDAFNYHFLDETIEATYVGETTIGKLSAIFTGLAIGISCLGLFGLAAFTFERKQKETGIRKVLGASSKQLTFQFSREFLILVVFAVVIASPCAWWLSTKWLNQFYYHTEFHWTFIAFAAMTALAIAIITVGWHALKATLANPVDSLRYE
ncbi:MAG: ABC transporter permease [Cyclobacteriaceae bacterium]|nr:MAG: ABC transporter permease [Cyclobacteriaceae bacterium]